MPRPHRTVSLNDLNEDTISNTCSHTASDYCVMCVHMSVHARAYFSGPMDHIIYSPQKAICFILLLLKSTGVGESILETQKKKKNQKEEEKPEDLYLRKICPRRQLVI